MVLLDHYKHRYNDRINSTIESIEYHIKDYHKKMVRLIDLTCW